MSEKLFDIEAFLGQCAGKKEIAVMILEEFVKQAPIDLTELETALSGPDLVEASRVAHRMKGTAGVLGTATYHQLCAEMEMACRNENSALAQELLPKVKESAQACVDYVPTLLTELP